MVARRIKNPHPLNKRCNRCRRCRVKTLYGIASRSRKLFKVTRRPETDIQETVFLDQPCFPLPPATTPETKTVFPDQPNSPLPPATNPDTETVLVDQPNLLLPPATNPDTKTVFLDLDATLISADRKKPKKHDFIAEVVKKNGKREEYYILKRPGVDEFLEYLGKKKFEVVLFTSGVKEYAFPIVEILDQNKVISHSLYRDSCKKSGDSFVKDLSKTGRNLEKVVIVDDNPRATALQPDNTYLIPPFKDDLEDKELWKVINFFQEYDGFDDLREAIRDFLLYGSENETGASGSSPDAATTMDDKASSSNTCGGCE